MTIFKTIIILFSIINCIHAIIAHENIMVESKMDRKKRFYRNGHTQLCKITPPLAIISLIITSLEAITVPTLFLIMLFHIFISKALCVIRANIKIRKFDLSVKIPSTNFFK